MLPLFGRPLSGNLERAARIELASSAWKAEVLPLHNARCVQFHRVEGGGGDRIRTYVHIRDQIYSLTPLTTRPPLHKIIYLRETLAYITIVLPPTKNPLYRGNQELSSP